MKWTFLRFTLAAGLLLAAATGGWGQTSIHASLGGRVTDPSGAPVGGARLTLRGVGVGGATTISDPGGNYLFLRLSPGEYSLSAEKEGFAVLTREGLVLAVNQSAVLDLELPLGALREEVNVTGDAAPVQVRSAELSTVVQARRIDALPLNGKNFQKLMLLVPGAAGAASSSLNNFSFSGARPSLNNYVLDGVGLNDERLSHGPAASGGAAGLGDAAPMLVPAESLQEFRAISSNADATFGRGSGGQINLITKSGGNRLSGSLYEYFRNDVLDSRDFFNYGPFFDASGRSVVPPFRQNLFGASLGGPLRRNGHHFFVNYEGFRQRLQQTATVTLPNEALIGSMPGDLGRFFRTYLAERGAFSGRLGTIGETRAFSGADRAAAVSAGFAPALFDGNLANGEAGTVLVSGAVPRNIDQDAVTVRTDHRVKSVALSARYSFARPNQLRAGETGLRLDEMRHRTRWQSAMAQAVWAVSPRQVLEVRGGLHRSARRNGMAEGLDSRLTALGVSPDFGVRINIAGIALNPVILRPGVFDDFQTSPQAAVHHSLSLGRWVLRSGLDVRRQILNMRLSFWGTPVYQFNGLVGPAGLLGSSASQAQAVAATVSATLFGANGGPTTTMRGYRSTQQEYFLNTARQLRPDLHLELGVRYSLFGVFREVNGAAATLYATQSGRPVPGVSPFTFGRTANQMALAGPGQPLYAPDRNNWQPRAGLAWDIAGRHTTVVRGAYGLYYDRLFQGQFDNSVTNVPYAISSQATALPFRLGVPLPVNPAIPAVWVLDPSLRNPRTQRFHVGIERALDSSTTLAAAYVGARAKGLIRALEPNGSGAVPQPLRPDPRFSDQRLIGSYSSSRYDALQLTLSRRSSRGVQAQATYTYGRSLDDVSADAPSSGVRTPSLVNLGANPDVAGVQGGASQFVDRPLRADWGRSDFDFRHHLVIAHTIDVPFRSRRLLLQSFAGGWSLGGLLQARSGEPFTVTLGRDVNDDGDATTDRPALSGALGDLYAAKGAGRVQFLVPAC